MTNKFSDDFIQRWEHIISGVEKTSVPINCIKKLVVRLPYRKQKTINIKALKNRGLDPEEIEFVINKRLEDCAEDIQGVDFFVDAESVAGIVQPATDDLLKKL
jgi:hypothetical protein